MDQQNFSQPSSAQQLSQKSIKPLWPVILLVLVIALVGVLLWQRNTANQIADSLQQQITSLQKQMLQKNDQSDNAVSQGNCVKEGERWKDGSICCSGLNLIVSGYDIWKNADGSISYSCLPDFLSSLAMDPVKNTCAACGNGVCGKGENQCNCPKDCTTYTTSKYSEGWLAYDNKNYNFSINFPTTWRLYDINRVDDPSAQISSYKTIFTPSDSLENTIVVSGYYIRTLNATSSLSDAVKYLGGIQITRDYAVAGFDAVKIGGWADLGGPDGGYCFFDGNKYLLFCITYNGTQAKKVFQSMVDSFKFTMPFQ
ncbi:MAG: hypothetical protein V1819_01770 [bacterium]